MSAATLQQPPRQRARAYRVLAASLLLSAVMLFALTGSGGASAWADRAEKARAGTHYMQALQCYHNALAWRPRAAQPYLASGTILLYQSRYAQARAALWQAHLLDTEDAEIMRALGDLSKAEGFPSQAAGWYAQAFEYAPDRADIAYALGMALIATDPSSAQAAISTAIRLDPKMGEAHYALGLLLASQDIQQAAVHLLTAAEHGDGQLATQAHSAISALAEVRQAPTDGERSALLGLTFARQRSWDLAVAELERANTLLPLNGEVLSYLAYALLQLDQVGRAVDLLRQATDLDPASPQAHHFLAIAYLRLGWPYEALEQLAIAYELDLRNPAIAAEIAQAYVESGAYDYAESWFELATRLSSDEPDYVLLQAAFHVEHIYHVRERGIPAAERGVAMRPDDARARDLLAWGNYLVGEEAGAEEGLLEAIMLDSGLARAHYHLAELYRSQSRYSAARAAYRRTIDLDRTGTLRELATASLEALKAPTR